MRLHEFVPVVDTSFEGESLIDTVFGPGFCAVDEMGSLLTTNHNRNLLRRAQMLVGRVASMGVAELGAALAELRARAETVTQDHYERAVRREHGLRIVAEPLHEHWHFDHSHNAGGLE